MSGEEYVGMHLGGKVCPRGACAADRGRFKRKAGLTRGASAKLGTRLTVGHALQTRQIKIRTTSQTTKLKDP